jgi:hypothetical protein
VATLKGVTLTLKIGPGVPIAAPQSVVDALDGVQTTTADERSGFQVSFVYSKTSPIARTLLPAGYFDPLNRVLIVATVNGVPHVLADGPITRQDIAPGAAPGTSKLTITGEDVSAYMDLIDFTGIPYPNAPPIAQVLITLAKYAWLGIVPLTIPPLYVDIKPFTNGYDHHEGTDRAYLTKLAKAAGYVFYVEAGPVPGANTAYFGPQIRVGVPQRALTIDTDQADTVDQLSFNIDANQAVLPVAYVRAPGIKIPIPVPVPDIGLLKPPLSARPFIPKRLKPIETERLSLPRAMMLALAGRGEADPVSGTGSLDVARYGNPLKARGLVGVRGAGLAYDGLFYVKSVTNTLARGSWKQSFNLVRDGLVANVPMVPA